MQSKKLNQKSSLVMIAIIYLLGIFMGAIDTGIVTPARTIIQNHLMVDEKTGIWMITIYTLAYAAAIPVMGKLADRYGRKIIYIVSIFLFGLGSLLCGLSNAAGSFSMLIIARAIQAVGGGGIMPVATAEFGTSFPPEKRGMALGLVGGVYGIANIFGSLAGSAILDIFGTSNWQYIFYVNIPISILIILGGFFFLPNHKEKTVKKIDGLGTLALVAMVLSLLYGLKQIDFFDFINTVSSPGTYPFLIIFVVLVPVFILVEKRAEDPIMNLKYFTSSRILITLVVAFISGFVMMGIVFIPQFCENALKVSSGSGGYFTVILGLLSGVSAMLSGRLIDKIGAKRVLMLGFATTIIGALFLIFVATVTPSLLTVIISLMLLGFGLGFTMGAPINYMMLENIDDSESNSGLATLSLLRSMGTSIAPAIMVGFLAFAGTNIQANLMAVMPNEITVPDLPYVEEISEKVEALKSDPNMAEMLGNVEIPNMKTIQLDFSGNGDFEMPAEIIEKFKSSDVTTIMAITTEMAETMFSQMGPEMSDKIQGGLSAGISGIEKGMAEMETSYSEMQTGYEGIKQGVAGMQSAIEAQKAALAQLENMRGFMAQMPAGAGGPSLADVLPLQAKASMPESVLQMLSEVKSLEELEAQIAQLQSAIASLEEQLTSAQQSMAQMEVGMQGMMAGKSEMEDLSHQMQALSDAIPAAFEAAKEDYLAQLNDLSEEIEGVYQSTLNQGYRSIYTTVGIAAAISITVMLLYRRKSLAENAPESGTGQ